MNEFVINVAQDPSTIININNSDSAVSLDIGQNQQNSITIEDDVNNVLLNPSVFYNGINIVYLSGVSGELLHNTFGDLQGGAANQYYHLSSGQYFNLTTGSVIRPNETGVFYPTSNPSGYITGVDLSNYSTISFSTGISGHLQNQVTNLNNQTGSYYPRNNPSGYITGVDLSSYATIGFVTGISGSIQNQITDLNYNTGKFLTTGAADNRYVDFNSNQTIYGNKTFSNDVYINHLFVTGTQTVANSTVSNVQSPYLLLNLTGGAFDGGLFFVTGSGLTGINDSGAIIGFDHSNKFKFGISTRASDLSPLATIGSVEEIAALSGYLQPQITNLNNQTGSYVTGSVVRPSETGVFVTQSQTGQFYAASNPSGFITGVDLSGYVTGEVVRPSETGVFIAQSQTGQFYPRSNPSGFITGINNIVYTTGDQNISGVKTFADNVGIGTTSPSAKLHAVSTTEQLRLGYDASNYLSTTVNASGLVTLDAVGSGAAFAFSNPVTATAQPSLNASTAKGVVTNELFDERMMEIRQCFAQTSVFAANGTQTNGQFFMNNGSIGFGTAPVANDAGAHAIFNFPTISAHGNNLSSNNAGGGAMIDWRVNHILGFDLMTFSNNTARDAILRVVLGNVATSGTLNGRLGSLISSSGYGIKMSKHPVNNTYQIQLVGRTCNLNNTNISNATNASPIVITYNGHNHQNGDLVEITGVGGNTAANGVFTISGVTTNTFILNGSTGNGAYTSGGGCQKISSAIVEVNPYTFYKFFIKYNFTSRTITLHLGTPSATASLTLTGLGVGTNATTYQLGTRPQIGIMAGADITGLGFLGINFNSPYIMTNRY
jgi:hypothetical protein